MKRIPSTAGYSATSLAKKLGIAEGTVVATIGAPSDYEQLLAPLPAGARVTRRLPREPELVHLFRRG